MTIREIKEKLEKLETAEEKIEFLESLLEKTKDGEDLDFINKMLDELNEDGIENILISEREISRGIAEFEPEDNIPRVNIGRSLDLAISNMPIEKREEKQESYGNGSYGFGFSKNYDIMGVQGMESMSSRGSDFIADLRDRFVREGVMANDRPLSEGDRSMITDKLRGIFPGASEESILGYQSSLLNAKPSNAYQKKVT